MVNIRQRFFHHFLENSQLPLLQSVAGAVRDLCATYRNSRIYMPTLGVGLRDGPSYIEYKHPSETYTKSILYAVLTEKMAFYSKIFVSLCVDRV